MGARQSRRSVDITTTPKKGEGEVAATSEEKIEKLGDADVKTVVTNGTAVHNDIEFADKDEEVKETEGKSPVEIKENGVPESSDGEKTPDQETTSPATGDQPAITEESVTEKSVENGNEKVAETPDSKKQKEKKKRKWSLRSISFSKKDKSKPGKEKDKNGEEIAEEKAEEANATTPIAEEAKAIEEKTPTEESPAPVTNGDATKEELTDKQPESSPTIEKEVVKEVIEAAVTKEEPKEVEKAEECVKPLIEECVKASVEESAKASEPAEVEIPATPAVVEEVKEVRSDEVPPPLPSSNPPSQVTVFAESTKELPVTEVLVSEKTESVPSEIVAISESKSDNILESEVPLMSESSKSEIEENVSLVAAHLSSESSKSEIEENVSPAIPSVASLSSESSKTEIEENVSIVTPTASQNLIEDTPENLILTSESTESPETKESLEKIDSQIVEQTSSPLLTEKDKSPIQEDSAVVIEEHSPAVIESSLKQSESSIQEIAPEAPLTESSLAQSEFSIRDIPPEASVISLNNGEPSSNSSLGKVSSETSNLGEGEPVDFESFKAENKDSLSSVPIVVEEKVPIISSAGDVPETLTTSDSQENNLEESKSNLNLKASPTSIEPSLVSEEESVDLSTILEVESNLRLTSETEPPTSNTSNQVSSSEEPNNDSITLEQSPVLPQKSVEFVCDAESLPDISTESLPSLPEPTDSILEPMSLPPLDSVPDPLVEDNSHASPVKNDSPTLEPIEIVPAIVLTNGNATNGLKSSPIPDDDGSQLPPSLDGPLKQIVAPEPTIADALDNSQTSGDAPVADSVESTPSTTAE